MSKHNLINMKNKKILMNQLTILDLIARLGGLIEIEK